MAAFHVRQSRSRKRQESTLNRLLRRYWWGFPVLACLLTAVYFFTRPKEPYRTCLRFVKALEAHDIDTLYALSHPKEKKELGLTPDNIKLAYEHVLKPLEPLRPIDITYLPHLSGIPRETGIRKVEYAVSYPTTTLTGGCRGGKECHICNINGNRTRGTEHAYVQLCLTEEGWRVQFTWLVWGVCCSAQEPWLEQNFNTHGAESLLAMQTRAYPNYIKIGLRGYTDTDGNVFYPTYLSTYGK